MASYEAIGLLSNTASSLSQAEALEVSGEILDILIKHGRVDPALNSALGRLVAVAGPKQANVVAEALFSRAKTLLAFSDNLVLSLAPFIDAAYIEQAIHLYRDKGSTDFTAAPALALLLQFEDDRSLRDQVLTELSGYDSTLNCSAAITKTTPKSFRCSRCSNGHLAAHPAMA